MRTAFFGTPPLAVPALHALAETTELVGVVCQPDRPAGRGLELAEPAVKVAARNLGVEVHQPVKVRKGDLHIWLRRRSVEAVIVLAYGRILPKAVLEAPRIGCINLHASLLPKYRGAAPIQWAIVRGETETGISVMLMDEGMDTGPVFSTARISIGEEETCGALTARMAELAADVVRNDLPRVLAGEILARPQDDAAATDAPLLTREHGRIDWSAEARDVANLVRGMTPRPGAHTTVRKKGLKVLAVGVDEGPAGPPGQVVVADRDALRVATSSGCVRILRAQLEGRRALAAADLVNGRVLRLGDQLGA